MKELFGEQKKIRFTGATASHQNVTAERIMNMVVTMERTILMHAALRCPEDTLSTDPFPI